MRRIGRREISLEKGAFPRGEDGGGDALLRPGERNVWDQIRGAEKRGGVPAQGFQGDGFEDIEFGRRSGIDADGGEEALGFAGRMHRHGGDVGVRVERDGRPQGSQQELVSAPAKDGVRKDLIEGLEGEGGRGVGEPFGREAVRPEESEAAVGKGARQRSWGIQESDEEEGLVGLKRVFALQKHVRDGHG